MLRYVRGIRSDNVVEHFGTMRCHDNEVDFSIFRGSDNFMPDAAEPHFLLKFDRRLVKGIDNRLEPVASVGDHLFQLIGKISAFKHCLQIADNSHDSQSALAGFSEFESFGYGKLPAALMRDINGHEDRSEHGFTSLFLKPAAGRSAR